MEIVSKPGLHSPMPHQPRRAGLASALTIATMLVVSGCRQTGTTQYDIAEPPMSCQQARVYNEQGTASWYGHAHNGLKTASGQRFNMNALTAAHRRLPFGTKIKVTNIDAGTSVVLTVNDRGPFVAGRLLDVSYRGARDLGFVQSGTATVRIETIETC